MDVVELFAGVGGFRLGLERCDKDFFHTVWANQWEPNKKNQFAYDCYCKHWGDTDTVITNKDIETVKGEVPNHDLLVGGFPCQDYSVATTQAKGIEGKKGVLWWSIYDIIKDKHPEYVMLENVDRLLKSPASQKGRDFAIMLKCLHSEGYQVEWKVVDASKYGAYQRRKRTYIFAYRKGSMIYDYITDYTARYGGGDNSMFFRTGFMANAFSIREVLCVHDFSLRGRSLQNISDDWSMDNGFYDTGYLICSDNGLDCTGKYCKYYPTNFNERCLHEILDIDVPDVPSKYYLDIIQQDKMAYLKGSKRIEREKDNGFRYTYTEGAIPFPDSLYQPSRTMLTSEGSMNRSSHVIKSSVFGLRFLTPNECEKLNGFPIDWTEGMTDRQRYFCMGNALVVDMITRMADVITKIELGKGLDSVYEQMKKEE